MSIPGALISVAVSSLLSCQLHDRGDCLAHSLLPSSTPVQSAGKGQWMLEGREAALSDGAAAAASQLPSAVDFIPRETPLLEAHL